MNNNTICKVGGFALHSVNLLTGEANAINYKKSDFPRKQRSTRAVAFKHYIYTYGGSEKSEELFRLDTVKHIFTRIPTSNKPQGRAGHAFFIRRAMIKPTLIVFGGTCFNNNVIWELPLFERNNSNDKKQNYWKKVIPSASSTEISGRSNFSFCYIEKLDSFFVYGGNSCYSNYSANDCVLNDLFKFDFQTRQWTEVSMPFPLLQTLDSTKQVALQQVSNSHCMLFTGTPNNFLFNFNTNEIQEFTLGNGIEKIGNCVHSYLHLDQYHIAIASQCSSNELVVLEFESEGVFFTFKKSMLQLQRARRFVDICIVCPL